MYTTLLTNTESGICTITINRPDKLNALNATVIKELGEALDEVISSPDIKAAIITGSGEKSFVAGADISEFIGLNQEEGEALSRVGNESVFNKIENASKPLVAAVNGFALGGGCELSMACHFRTASDRAKFGQPEVNLGLIPGYGGTQRLPRLIGPGKAMELLMTGDMIGADEAKALGLVNHVFSAEELLPSTIALVSKIITKAPLAIGRIIALVNDAAEGHPDGFEHEIAQFGQSFETADMKEGTAAFMEKRKPVFTGN
jgi:enoyl-CoA hydratase